MRESLAPSTAVLPTSRRSAVSAKAKLEQRSKSQVTIHKHVVYNAEKGENIENLNYKSQPHK
jgi:hypothetical protein